MAKYAERDSLLAEFAIDGRFYVQSAASKIYSRGWDGLTFAAELHKLVRMFRRFLPNLIDFVKKGRADYDRLRNWKDFGYASLNAWLEGRYGWRILMYDLKDIIELAQALDKEQLYRVKDRVGDSFVHVVDDSTTGSGGHIIDVTDTTTYSLSVRGSIIADFTPARISTNLPLTLYELIPYSFVVDWVIHFGRALEAISFLSFADKYTASFGAYYSAERQGSIAVSFGPPTWSNGGYSNWDQTSLVETWEVRMRRPMVVPTSPLVNVNLNAFKVMDLVALFIKAIT